MPLTNVLTISQTAKIWGINRTMVVANLCGATRKLAPKPIWSKQVKVLTALDGQKKCTSAGESDYISKPVD